MQKLSLDDLNQWIGKRQKEVERTLIRNRGTERPIRTRERDSDEVKILDHLCKQKWEKAEKEGKIKYITERVWFYDFD
ncbi:hypothetical protein [Ammoniphilus sp. YIM 78166]|uniref:hypothetical protein n=1 Tax=Ammoniphilus sp. YIM 78166 TaxID=1644106 RepID=UPI00106FA0DE|nr:hypothetical protein [Ammoniphilus sp. YIM 78166]